MPKQILKKQIIEEYEKHDCGRVFCILSAKIFTLRIFCDTTALVSVVIYLTNYLLL